MDASQLLTVEFMPGGFSLLNISPVPTLGNLNIEFLSENNKALQIEVLDLLGAQLILQDYTPVKGVNQLNISLENLKAGIYFLKMSRDHQGTPILTKIVKQ